METIQQLRRANDENQVKIKHVEKEIKKCEVDQSNVSHFLEQQRLEVLRCQEKVSKYKKWIDEITLNLNSAKNLLVECESKLKDEDIKKDFLQDEMIKVQVKLDESLNERKNLESQWNQCQETIQLMEKKILPAPPPPPPPEVAELDPRIDDALVVWFESEQLIHEFFARFYEQFPDLVQIILHLLQERLKRVVDMDSKENRDVFMELLRKHPHGANAIRSTVMDILRNGDMLRIFMKSRDEFNQKQKALAAEPPPSSSSSSASAAKRIWTEEENERLKGSVERNTNKDGTIRWQRIEKYFNGERTRDDCKSQMRRIQQSGAAAAPKKMHRQHFTKREKNTIYLHGMEQTQKRLNVDWSLIIHRFPGRTAHSLCRCWIKMRNSEKYAKRVKGEEVSESEDD